jgi:fermentation-respiration switch protein FrsA (DUF1100 family)
MVSGSERSRLGGAGVATGSATPLDGICSSKRFLLPPGKPSDPRSRPRQQGFSSTFGWDEFTAGFSPLRRGAPFTVLFCHGNAGNISGRLDRSLLLHRNLGVEVFLFDYRGFGRSEGRPTEEGTYRDAVAAHRYLVEERRIARERLILFGESLGAAVAIELSLREAAAALVLEAPFTSIADMARVAYPFLSPITSFVRTRYDNLKKIPEVALPLLLFHARRDQVVPFEQGEALFRAAREPKTFVAVENAGHADAFVAGGEGYWSAWRDLFGTLDSARAREG